MKRLVVVVLTLVSSIAFAQAQGDDAPPPAPAPPPEPVAAPEPPPPPTPNAEIDARMRVMEKRLEKLEDDLSQAKDDTSYLEEKVQQLLPLTAKFGGYVDFGFFATDGNGAGTREDLTNSYFPEYAGKVPGSWVFMGDPLATMINSRGDVADTGNSRAITFDPIHTGGASTFLINAVNFQMFTGIGDTVSLFTSIDFLPRSRNISDPSGLFDGDYLDVKLAYAEWKPKIDAFSLAIQAGKFDSVVGYEYRLMESPDRINVTPSLLCRYVCGHPIGLKARMKFLGDALIANVAITNGSNFSEGFDFSDETDKNQFKTGSFRLSYQIAHTIEFGVSGAFGAQDWQASDSVYQWHTGVDVHADWKNIDFTAELVHGRANGQTTDPTGPECDIAPCLHYTGAYVLTAYRATNTFEPFFRVDWRSAEHDSGASFAYISDLVRFTAGLRAEISPRVIAKVEGTVVRELNAIQFPDDVVTSSLVLKY